MKPLEEKQLLTKSLQMFQQTQEQPWKLDKQYTFKKTALLVLLLAVAVKFPTIKGF